MAKVVNIENAKIIKDVPDHLVWDFLATKEWLPYNEELENKEIIEKAVRKNQKLEDKRE